MKTFFIVSLVIFKFIVSISSVALHKSDHSHENLPKEDFFINKIYEKFSNENVNFSLISIGGIYLLLYSYNIMAYKTKKNFFSYS